jgi:hypothetical protein
MQGIVGAAERSRITDPPRLLFGGSSAPVRRRIMAPVAPLDAEIRSDPISLSWGEPNVGRRHHFVVLPPLLPPFGNTCLRERKHFFYVKKVETSAQPFPR